MSPPCVDLSAEALLIKQGKIAGMVYMRVGEQNAFYLRRVDGKFAVHKYILTLFHPVVDKYVSAVCFDEGTASGNFMRGAQKSKFHI
jgi:hypothetical protein